MEVLSKEVRKGTCVCECMSVFVLQDLCIKSDIRCW
jgi:hypothetical protein